MKNFLMPLTAIFAVTLLLGVGCTNSKVEPAQNDNAALVDQTTDALDTTVADDESVVAVSVDVYGKDFDFAVRYPESIRSYYSSNEYQTSVTYQTTAGVEKVRDFYNEKLTAAGWTNSEEATDYMEYVKGDEVNPEIVTLYLTDYASQGLVEYELVYEPALTDKQMDDVSGETFEDIEF